MPAEEGILNRGRFSFAAGNGRRPAAISAGKRNATPVYDKLTADELD